MVAVNLGGNPVIAVVEAMLVMSKRNQHQVQSSKFGVV